MGRIEERKDGQVESSKTERSQVEEDNTWSSGDTDSRYQSFLKQYEDLDRMCKKTNFAGERIFEREKLVRIQMDR